MSDPSPGTQPETFSHAPPREPMRPGALLRALCARGVRWPMPFALTLADESLLETAEHKIDVEATTAAPPAAAYALFRDFARTPQWMPGFLHHALREAPPDGGPPVLDEMFIFMTLRERLLRDRAGHEWLAATEACTLPLATRMISHLRFEPAGRGTRVRWRTAFDVPAPLRLFAPPVVAAFRAWFARGLANFARLADAQPR